MRTAGGLFPRLVEPELLERAARATVRGKRRRREVASFLFRLDEELARLRSELQGGTYQPSHFDLVAIRDPKPRLIARVPIRDRVLHTALVTLIEPVFAPSFTDDDFACRRGLGTHRALLRLVELTRRYRFALHLDIRSYFPSIDREILKGLLRRRLRDRRFLAVVERVLDQGHGLYSQPAHRRIAGLHPDWPPPDRGLPIGSYTSQLFAAHIYLNAVDHFVKRDLKVRGYLRYVDDLFCFADRRCELRAARRAIAAWLEEERHLRLKHPEARVLSCRGHLVALGHRVSRQGVEPLARAARRFRRRLAVAGVGGHRHGRPVDLRRSLAAHIGVLLP